VYTFLFSINSLANTTNEDKYVLGELSKEYIEYLKLSDEEKSNRYAPRIFDIDEDYNIPENELKIMRMVGSTSSARYSLRDVIPENLKIRDQKLTMMCWTFGALSSVETNLALTDYYNKSPKKVYDFSERHMEYATVRKMKDKENKYGFNRTIDSGGRSLNKHDTAYLTNGMGAINESEMPFSLDMSEQNLSYIQNKKVVSQVYDTIDFPCADSRTVTEELKNKMKEHIKNYGSINVLIYGASATLETDATGKYYCYNNDTGALYCDIAHSLSFPVNHAVSIIGWDDNYSIDNFNSNSRPHQKGAWIVRNSWGEAKYSVAEQKEYLYYLAKMQNLLGTFGWSSPDDITDEYVKEFFEANNWKIDSDGSASFKMGDNGIYYISYEDCNVYTYMTGIVKAENKVSYDNLYQYDELGNTTVLNQNLSSTIWIGNIFSKKTSQTEYLTQISIYASEKVKCKVWVNLNSSSKEKSDMTQVALQAGEYEILEPGYHTLEFATPMEIKSNNFFVAVEMNGYRNDNQISFTMEGKWGTSIDNPWSCVEVQSGKCFITTNPEDTNWQDLSEINLKNGYGVQISGGDSNLKAFTTNTNTDDSLKEIKITTPPNKTSYFEGENFDKTGMVVTAFLNNGDSNEITEYTITDGDNLSAGKTSVTISYEGKNVTQTIKVVKNKVESLKITKQPTKIAYKAGEDFDKSGMIVTATYSNGDTKTITDYEIIDGDDLKNGQTGVIISYEGKQISQKITVTENKITKIEITSPPKKTTYIEGQDFDKTGMIITAVYEDGSEKEVVSYTVIDGIKLTKNKTFVTIKFEDKQVNQSITVSSKTATSIIIKSKPSKLSYIQNEEELSLSGGSVTVRYNDGSSEEVLMTSPNISVSGFDNSKVGKNKITIKYLNLSTSFEVDIVAKVEKLPENSNFDKVHAKNKYMKIYYNSSDSSKNYALIDIEISDIEKATVNDKLEYAFYLSSNQSANSIPESQWIRLDKMQISDGKLSFTIDTKDLSNYDEVTKSDKLYLYVKEIATRNGKTKICITKSMDISSAEEKQEYVDGIKKEDSNGSGNHSGGTTTGKDDTTANEKYPYTGKTIFIVICFIIIGFGTIGFIKYKTIDK